MKMVHRIANNTLKWLQLGALACLLLVSVQTFAGAQGNTNTGGSGNKGNKQSPCPPNCPAVPIDGGIGILMAAGLAYGAKRVYDARKRAKV